MVSGIGHGVADVDRGVAVDLSAAHDGAVAEAAAIDVAAAQVAHVLHTDGAARDGHAAVAMHIGHLAAAMDAAQDGAALHLHLRATLDEAG